MIDDYLWIKTDEELSNVAELWSKSSVLALDTEFVRTETFYAYLGLIQVCQGDATWLIDPLGITNWQPFANILTNERIVKVFHALSEDAEILKQNVGVLLRNVFDTQIAAAFLGHPHQVSYAKLVEHLFGVHIPKEVTRSNWLKRPLNEEQCRYAAADVHWLYLVYQDYAQQLKQQNRYHWIIEDSERLVNNNLPVEPDRYYLKLRGGWKLKGNSLEALRILAAWRETLAREQNCNRGRIVQDKDLIAIAEKMPSRKSELQLHARQIRLYSDQILQIVKQARSTARSDWPPRIASPLPANQTSLLKKVRDEIGAVAKEHKLLVEVLAGRKVLEEWLRSGLSTGEYVMPESLCGWRENLLLEPIGTMLVAQWKETHES